MANTPTHDATYQASKTTNACPHQHAFRTSADSRMTSRDTAARRAIVRDHRVFFAGHHVTTRDHARQPRDRTDEHRRTPGLPTLRQVQVPTPEVATGQRILRTPECDTKCRPVGLRYAMLDEADGGSATLTNRTSHRKTDRSAMSRPLAGPQTLLRSINGRAILETLASDGPQTRTDLMEATGLSRTAVTQVLRMLESAGAVAPDGVDRSSRGPAAGKVGLHPHLGFAAAVHVDHRAAHVVLVDATGAVRAEAHGDFPRKDDNETRVAHIAALIDRCNATVAGPLHLALIGVPGIVTADGSIRNDQGPDGGAFRSALTDRLGCPVRIENDVNLAALAELTSGAGAELSSFAAAARRGSRRRNRDRRRPAPRVLRRGGRGHVPAADAPARRRPRRERPGRRRPRAHQRP
jgi:DNA-binding Lrp family transcriptional regulator